MSLFIWNFPFQSNTGPLLNTHPFNSLITHTRNGFDKNYFRLKLNFKSFYNRFSFLNLIPKGHWLVALHLQTTNLCNKQKQSKLCNKQINLWGYWHLYFLLTHNKWKWTIICHNRISTYLLTYNAKISLHIKRFFFNATIL